MMNLFYYSNHREEDESIGITNKVRAQIREFRAKGYNVYFSAYTNDGIGIYDSNNKLVLKEKFWVKKGKLNHYFRRIQLLKMAGKYIQSKGKNFFDITYMRFHFWDVFSLNFIKIVKSTNPDGKLIVEAHSFPYKNKSNNKSFSSVMVEFMDNIYQRGVNKYIDLVAGVTEIDTSIWGCKTIKIENGINNNFRPRKYHKPTDTCKILFVGNELKSHGLQRIIRGIYNYYREGDVKNKIELYLVGEMSKGTCDLVRELNLEDKVFLLGKKSGEGLQQVYDMCDCGVGLLEGYLMGYHAGICMKTKEYMVVGLPFITSAKEDAEVVNHPYVFCVPENALPISVQSFIDFIYNLDMSQEVVNEIHNYAVEKYSWKEQIEKILEAVG